MKGYRQVSPDEWIAFSDSSRYAQLFPDGCGNHTGTECYADVVANIPRTNSSDKMYCCLGAGEIVAPGICCPKVLIPFLTEGAYFVVDRDEMADDCSQTLNAHLCTLAELKDAYLLGYRQPLGINWLFFAMAGRDAQLYKGGCGDYIDDECYEGVVANTQRPTADQNQAFCCPSLD